MSLGIPEPGSPQKKHESELLAGLAKVMESKSLKAFVDKYTALKKGRKLPNGTRLYLTA